MKLPIFKLHADISTYSKVLLHIFPSHFIGRIIYYYGYSGDILKHDL